MLLQADSPSHEQMAHTKTEALIRHGNTAEAYEMLQLYCELLSDGIHLMSQCPPDLLSYGVTLIWATIIVDLPELREIRKYFQHMYGEGFVADALKNTGGVVNERVLSKLLAPQPSASLVQTHLQKIAHEYNVDWKPDVIGVKKKASNSSTKNCTSYKRKDTNNSTASTTTSSTKSSSCC